VDNTAFPRLATLEAVVAATSPETWRMLPKIAIVCCQHLLETTGSLIECLIRHGLPPARVFIVGKVYSSNRRVAQTLSHLGCDVMEGSRAKSPGYHSEAIEDDAKEMWQHAECIAASNVVEGIVVLDDGAHMAGALPPFAREFCRRRKVIGVEQTTSGLIRKRTILPVVNVASSAIKRHIEPGLICQAILHRVRSLVELRSQGTRCGVIGLGKVGGTLASELRRNGYTVFGYDIDDGRLESMLPRERCKSIVELVGRSDLIFGCTGRDSVPPADAFDGVRGEKTFASCSSSDGEFRSLLRQPWLWTPMTGEKGTCPTLVSSHGAVSLRVLRSGYPVNFDNSPESVPRDDIQLTRGLLLGAVLQAVELIASNGLAGCNTIMLDPNVQRIVRQSWRSTVSDRDGFDMSWYERESRGNPVPCRAFRG